MTFLEKVREAFSTRGITLLIYDTPQPQDISPQVYIEVDGWDTANPRRLKPVLQCYCYAEIDAESDSEAEMLLWTKQVMDAAIQLGSVSAMVRMSDAGEQGEFARFRFTITGT